MRPDEALSAKTAVLLAMGEASGGAFIGNLQTTISEVATSAGTLPVTRNDGAGATCYVCCPTVAYVDYALSELRHFTGTPLLKAALAALVNASRPVLWLSGVDRHVQLNNWLLATNPVPDLAVAELEAITRAAVAEHPRHAVVWRSLNAVSDAGKLARFRAAGYDLFPARQVYLFDCTGSAPPRHRDERRDAALLDRGDYAAVGPGEIGDADYARMAELYGRLYLDKYTRLNPHYSAQFIAAAHRGGLIAFHGLRRDGRLDGVVGFFDAGAVMTAPLVGYDTALPAALGLYRRLMAIGMRRAREAGLLFNMSAGAAGFKRNRGGVPAIEYAAVHTRHLKMQQRAAGWIVRTVLERVGETLLTRLEL
jgi:hypothetical protein